MSGSLLMSGRRVGIRRKMDSIGLMSLGRKNTLWERGDETPKGQEESVILRYPEKEGI